MKNTTKLTASSFDFDLDHGFAVVTIDDAQKSTVQCCLILRDDRNGYIKQIDRDDSGINESDMKQANQAAFDLYGVDKCQRLLFATARKMASSRSRKC